jgi:hypothetical protein
LPARRERWTGQADSASDQSILSQSGVLKSDDSLCLLFPPVLPGSIAPLATRLVPHHSPEVCCCDRAKARLINNSRQPG